ncbi:hypothetical protein DVK85_08445 [Flavobacterium arcticum]|uniref:Uncharacterized protein n=1 Tax=Flavobacterium arcticum TaxID=1784713 RepID=A0A345HCF2_9FLAO|nr:hypothetical protein [Flavobacterium arcticum]AXG74262.1 hypothetical protein DVK85_08445 [Flavobacterium arcticum]KAF2508147.1 hypothetical protein E0W72_10855 [Flavobacterium arcticum]
MLGVFKKINRIMCERLTWNPIQGEERKYYSNKYSQNECWIQMNDFPEEPLWTIFYKEQTKDIEDTPILWKINYPNKKPLI